VVCANTLTAALGGNASYQYTVRHKGDLNAQLVEARQALGVADRYFSIAGQAYKALALKTINSMQLDSYLVKFLPIGELSQLDTASDERERIMKSRDAIRQLFEGGRGSEIPGVRGTAWGAYNATTEWIDRVRSTKKDGTPRVGSAEANVLGVGQDLRNRAMAALQAV
jgi:phage/plasmid-like protein (TIGR03299 family)